MNAELQTKVVSWIETAAQKVSDFTSTELPPFIHEFLRWKMYENVFYVVEWLFVGILLGGFIALWYKFQKKNVDWDDIDQSFRARLFSCFLGILVIVLLFHVPNKNIKDIIEISVAPKVYLLETARNLIK